MAADNKLKHGSRLFPAASREDGFGEGTMPPHGQPRAPLATRGDVDYLDYLDHVAKTPLAASKNQIVHIVQIVHIIQAL